MQKASLLFHVVVPTILSTRFESLLLILSLQTTIDIHSRYTYIVLQLYNLILIISSFSIRYNINIPVNLDSHDWCTSSSRYTCLVPKIFVTCKLWMDICLPYRSTVHFYNYFSLEYRVY